MFDHRYPGTDLHEIDLAYILGEIQALKYKLDNFVKENTFHLADPLDWNITTQYSACTIVRYHDDRLYLSAKPVPAGIQITNTEYWLNLIDCSGGGGGDYQEREVSFIPTETQQLLDVYPEAGYDALSKVRVIVQAISNLFVGSGIPRRSSADLTASGAQVSAPSGYYANAAVKSVQAGTEGTPTATKGPVSNHAIAVTPAVTNTEGYIAGGTKTGSAVSVTAAELVSGSQTITQNGNVDVTNLESVTVAVPSDTPTLQTKSVTYTPQESGQMANIVPDAGYDGLSSVTVMVNRIPQEYIIPTGTLAISQNGTFDVTQYASASVNVSGGGGSDLVDIIEGDFSGAFVNSEITRVKTRGLSGNSGMTSVSLPNCTYLGDRPFEGNTYITSVNLPALTSTGGYIFTGLTRLVGSLIFPLLTSIGTEFIGTCHIDTIVLPALTTGTGAGFASNNSTLLKADFGPGMNQVVQNAFNNCTTISEIILRRSSAIVPLVNINAFSNTKFSSSGTGGTIYIPKALYDHLGDGTSLDYKAAANWSTIDGYGHTTWAAIEGSQYENYYVDGTPIT